MGSSSLDMSISQILSQDSQPRPCAGFEESLVLAVKDCFLESDMREILIERSGGGVMFFSRLCTSLATVKRVCSHCDHWFTQISPQNRKISFFGIDNFLDTDLDKENPESDLDVETENTDEVEEAVRPRKEKRVEEVYSCSRCERDFKSRKKYLNHRKKPGECQSADTEKVTGSKAVCEHCGALISPNNMKQHVRRLHTHSHNNLSCEHCAKQFKYRSELAVHLTHHTGELNYSCSACAKKFRRAAEVREVR